MGRVAEEWIRPPDCRVPKEKVVAVIRDLVGEWLEEYELGQVTGLEIRPGEVNVKVRVRDSDGGVPDVIGGPRPGSYIKRVYTFEISDEPGGKG